MVDFRLSRVRTLLFVLIALLVSVTVTRITAQTAVTAEAIGSANVRTGAGVEYDIVAEIKAGTRYPVIGRNAQYPWLLIQLPNAQGWVFTDLVTVQGDLNTVPYTDQTIQNILPTATTGITADITSTPSDPNAPTIEPSLTPVQPTATPAAIAYAEAINEANVRYGPGPEFSRIGTIKAGTKYPIVRRHSQFPWVELNVEGMAGGRGWVFTDLVTITGDINSVTLTAATEFGYPTLTPTPFMVGTAVPPFVSGAYSTPTPGNPDTEGQTRTVMRVLSEQIYDYLLERGFEPRTNKQASAFIMDMRTGESYDLNPGVAFSGMSLIKFPILVALYRKLDTTVDAEIAANIADMIICSENLASNYLLRVLGDGNEYRGAEYVTETMTLYGLKNTFLVGPLFIPGMENQPAPTREPVTSIRTGADQIQTAPDDFNQSTPSDMGYLMAGVYQCAVNDSGPLRTSFPDESTGAITMDECRHILRTMGANDIPAMLRAGLPAGTYLAHKHGWVNEASGDAGLVVSPGGDYIVVIMLYTKNWLLYDESFPYIAEVSRLIYNAVNPNAPLASSNTQPVPLCTIETINTSDPDLITDLQSETGRPIK